MSLLALVGAALSPSRVIAQQTDAIISALDDGDINGAAKQIGQLEEQRGSKAAADRRLDAYYGRFFAALGQGSVAEAYLSRAIAAANNRAERDALALELARTREVDGFVNTAAGDYQRLTAPDGDPAVRRDATLALARLKLGAAPEEAVSLLIPLAGPASPPPTRWEANLQLSRAYAIQGRSTDARAALAEAWHDAPLAAVPADAIAVTAMDMAVDRATNNDRRGEIGLASIGQGSIQFGGTAQLPVCGAAVRREDSVIVAIAPDAKRRPFYSAVRASRPGIAQLFTVPLAVTRQRMSDSPIYVTLRCRIALDSNVRVAGGVQRNLQIWLAEKGYYPPLRPIDAEAGDPVAQLKARVQELEASAGKDSPALTPVLLWLSFAQGAQSRFGNAGNFADAKAIAERAIAILTKAGAPDEVIQQLRVQTTVAFAQNQNIADVAGPAALEAVSAVVARPSTTPAQALATMDEVNGWQLRPTDRLALADRVLTFLDARHVAADDIVRQAIELRRAGESREIGTVAGTNERLAAHGIASDLCASADRPASVPPAAITLTSEDYPKDLLRRSVIGLTVLELSVDAAGKVTDRRVIASQPVDLFDAVTADKLKAVTMLPAQRDGKPVSCRGMIQTVRWQIPYDGNYAVPFGGFPFAAD